MVHERVHLPERAELVGQALLRMVLLSTSELSIATGLSEDQVGRGLRDLQDEKFLRSAELGCLRPGVPLMWLTPAGLDQFGASAAERSWHEPAGVGNLILYDLSKVEAVNSIACWYSTVSLPLSRIWRYKQPQPMCAAAEYCRPGGPKAHIVFCRVSLLDNQLELFYHLAALPAAMQAQAMDPDEPFHPDELCLIAHDEWGAVQALQMACAILPQWVPPRCITAWYPSDGSWRVCDGYSVERGTRPRLAPRLVPTGGPSLHPSTSIRKLGKRKFERILERCHWAGRGGHELFRLLTAVGVYPVAAASHLKAFVGEAQAGTETNWRLRILVKMGLVEVVAEKARAQAKRVPKGVPMTISDRGQGADRYGLTTAGRTAFCSAHGGTPDALASRTEIKRPKEAKDDWTLAEHLAEHWKFRHEDGVYEVLAQLAEMGCPVALGWRGRVTLANRARIWPDGMVLLKTPWGRAWFKFEFELRARSPKACAARCAKYASLHRLDDDWLLLVCNDERAEANFHEAGDAYPRTLTMLTTTLRRLRDGGVAGEEVWSYYGARITLTAP